MASGQLPIIARSCTPGSHSINLCLSTSFLVILSYNSRKKGNKNLQILAFEEGYITPTVSLPSLACPPLLTVTNLFLLWVTPPLIPG